MHVRSPGRFGGLGRPSEGVAVGFAETIPTDAPASPRSNAIPVPRSPWRPEDRPSDCDTYFDRLVRYARVEPVAMNELPNWRYVTAEGMSWILTGDSQIRIPGIFVRSQTEFPKP